MHLLEPTCRVRFRSGHTLDVLTDMETTARLLFGVNGGDDAYDRGFAGLISRGCLHDVYPSDVAGLEPLERAAGRPAGHVARAPR